MIKNEGNFVENIYFPMIVSASDYKEDDDKDILERWNLFDKLSEDKKEILISEDTAIKIKKICQNFLLSVEQSREISRIVRDVFLGLIHIDSLEENIRIRMNNFLPDKHNLLVKNIEDKIFSLKISKGTQSEKLAFSDAMKKYAEIGEQLITSEKISLKNFPDPVRPSIKNWLSDYAFNAGYEKHNAMQRGGYLFQNSNAKVLNSADRQKLSYILKTYDENEEVEINVNLKQIIFPKSDFFSSEEKKINGVRRDEEPQDIFEKYSVPAPQIKQSEVERKNPAVVNLKTMTQKIETTQKRPVELNQVAQMPSQKIQPNNNFPAKGINIQGGCRTPDFGQEEKIGQNMNMAQNQTMPSARKMNFSSPHKFPAEKKEKQEQYPPENLQIQHLERLRKENLMRQREKRQFENSVSTRTEIRDNPPAQFNPSAQMRPQPQPMRITPQGMDDFEEENSSKQNNITPKNVVNLREG